MTLVVIINIFIAITMLVGSFGMEIEPSDADFLRKQEMVFQLLWSTKDKPKNHPEVYERIKNYRIEDLTAACDNQTYAKNLENHLKNGVLGRDHVFSDLRDEHVDDVKSLAEAFRSAKTFEDFLAMAAWSRLITNELSWLHAFAIALAHRSDSKHLRMPNLHEILPHYFFNSDVIMRAYRIKTGEVVAGTDYTIDANYSIRYAPQDQNEEYELSYFQEDVALNEFNFQLAVNCPFWMTGEECKLPKAMRGEFSCYVRSMILARYKLERLSRGLADLEEIDWEQPITTGYYPSMMHLNGLQFPVRPTGARLPSFKYKFLEEVKHYESRISRAADLGELRSSSASSRSKIYSSEATNERFNDFCNALEGNADTLHRKFYGSLDRTYRRLLGFSPESPNTVGLGSSIGALEMSLTSLRDPGFYRLSKKIDDYAFRFKRNNFAPYGRDELGFEGVRLDYLHVERLVSYMASYESSVNHLRVLDLVDTSSAQSQAEPVKVRQMRLSHKPFTYEIGVSSESPSKAIVRLLIGPARDRHGNQLELADSLRDFYELDRWIVELKQGNNKLERNSADSIYTTVEPRASESYWRSLSVGLKSYDESLVRELLAQRKHRRALPRRLLLPRGTRAGFPLRLLVCLHSVQQTSAAAANQRLPEDAIFGSLPLDGRALGFPLDRPLAQSLGNLGDLRNFLTKDVLLYHEDVAKD